LGLAKNVGISNHQAEEFIKKYFETFPKVKTYLDQTVADAHLNGSTKTILNRVRFITELKSDNKALVAFGERTAMNSPIQGSAADLIKVAMVRVQEAMKGLKSLLIAQVHDELVFDVYPGEEELLSTLVRKEMEGAMKLLVPIKVEMGLVPIGWKHRRYPMDIINRRRSVRQFSEKEVPMELVTSLLKAAMQAPSAHNEQPWRFIVITKKGSLEAMSQYQLHPNY
jgi:predicted phosphatase